MVRTFAAIDVGSYQLELAVYELSEKQGIRTVDHVRHVIGLGIDTYKDGKISYHMVEEVCEVLSGFMRIMKTYQVEAYRAYAASALREARNCQIVLDQVRVRTGIDIRIISNSEQRFINYKAVASKTAGFTKTIQRGTAIVSAGFGSTQISLFDRECLVSTQNLPLGALRVRELLDTTAMTAAEEQQLVGEMVENELATFRKIYLKDREIKNLIIDGEPIMPLYYKVMRDRGRDRVSVSEFQALFAAIRSMTPEQLEENFDISRETANLLYPAAVVVRRMLELTGAETVWIPGTCVTDGIAAEYAEEKKILKLGHSFENDILEASRNMAKRYRCHMQHVQAVEEHAVQIFDALKKYHGMKSRDRLLLRIAAILHSCGKFVTMRDATDCAYHIIMSTEIIGLSHAEREIVANVVRYHIQKFGYDEVKMEEDLSRSIRPASAENPNMLIAKLTAILRLANSMDRGHKHKLEGCRLAVKDNQLIITTDTVADIGLERMSVEHKAEFFEEIFGIRPVLKQKKRV